MTKILMLSAALAAAPAIAFAGDMTTVSVNPTTVEIRNMHFTPASLTIAAGTKVTWINKDGEPHTVTDRGLAFRSAALDTQDSFSYTFAIPGEFTYFCTIHPIMIGRIIVKPAAAAPGHS